MEGIKEGIRVWNVCFQMHVDLLLRINPKSIEILTAPRTVVIACVLCGYRRFVFLAHSVKSRCVTFLLHFTYPSAGSSKATASSKRSKKTFVDRVNPGGNVFLLDTS